MSPTAEDLRGTCSACRRVHARHGKVLGTRAEAARACARTAHAPYRGIPGLIGCEVLWRRVAVPGAGRALLARATTR
ncbi:hypothetical protein SAMN05216188_104296 [Lentzea xinjiangensis]|uniref:Uncharacterized protein n=1 Tax=Lentzea xinjiangensis TaxID=402600 RepID=A0A1H9I123_9PSEU|nr:hypothetical protein [Lentzea xinjiangensis]SEQ68289.1 hypothetical protein SAMN05216188_104296 [Lentzea xinjiangensis]